MAEELDDPLALQYSEIHTVCIVNEVMAKVPEEVWMFMLMFVDDVDLQTLSKTCRLLNRLTKDALLWRSVHLRNKGKVHTLLFKFPQRATRERLAVMNIMRGRCLERKLSEGQYVGGAAAVRAYEAYMRIQKESTMKAVTKGLEDRPPMNEMSLKNLLPQEVKTGNGERGSCSPRLIPKVLNLKKAMTLDSLKKQLRTRISVEGFRESGVAKTHTVTAYNPSIHSKAVELDKRLCEIHLVSKLVRRPSAGILESMKVLHTTPDTAVLICPSIKSKLDFFESLQTTPVGACPGEGREHPDPALMVIVDGPEEVLSATTCVAESPETWTFAPGEGEKMIKGSPLVESLQMADVVA
ncbi:hypothetical protein HDU67_001490 [Dinochytrium kinnereticum]|nr:hypothetical protein HDU67_001490 [Dinochytrium kinnereticum]